MTYIIWFGTFQQNGGIATLPVTEQDTLEPHSGQNTSYMQQPPGTGTPNGDPPSYDQQKQPYPGIISTNLQQGTYYSTDTLQTGSTNVSLFCFVFVIFYPILSLTDPRP